MPPPTPLPLPLPLTVRWRLFQKVLRHRHRYHYHFAMLRDNSHSSVHTTLPHTASYVQYRHARTMLVRLQQTAADLRHPPTCLCVGGDVM